MSAVPFVIPALTTDDGTPESGALIYFKKKGTSTNQVAYLDDSLDTPCQNPEPCDAGGRQVVYLDGEKNYDITVKDAAGAITYLSVTYNAVSSSTGGADPDASGAANQAAFLSIPIGSCVDLQGLTYTVTDAYAVCDWIEPYNGALQVGSTRYAMARSPKEWASDGPVAAAQNYGFRPYIAGLGHFAATDINIRGDWLARRHVGDVGAPLIVRISYGGGRYEQAITVPVTSTRQPGFFCGGMISPTRFAIAFRELQANGTETSAKFFYFDGANPIESSAYAVQDISVANSIIQSHGSLVLDDSGGVSFYGGGYLNNGATAADIGILQARSTSAIAGTPTFTHTVALSMTSVAEPWVLKTPAGFLMFLRTETGGSPTYVPDGTVYTGGHLLMSRSPTGLPGTWTKPISLGLDAGSNPPSAVALFGKVDVVVTPRRNDPVDGFADKILVYRYNASTLYSATTAPDLPAPHVAFSSAYSVLGYAQISRAKPNGVEYAFVAEENQAGPSYISGGSSPSSAAQVAYSRIIGLGGDPVVPYDEDIPNPETLTHNSTFQLWQGGTSFASITTTPTITCDRWKVLTDTGTVDVTRQVCTDAETFILPWAPKYKMRIASTVNAESVRAQQIFYGADQLRRFCGRVVTFVVWAKGTAAAQSAGNGPRVILNFGTGGSPSPTIRAGVSFRQSQILANMTVMTATMSIPRFEEDDGTAITLGSDNNAYFAFEWEFCADATAATSFELFALSVNEGAIPVFPKFVDPEDARQQIIAYREILRYSGTDKSVCVADFGSTSSGYGHLPWQHKIGVPAVSIVSGSAASFEQYGTTPATGVTFDRLSEAGGRILLASSAAFTTGIGGLTATNAELLVYYE